MLFSSILFPAFLIITIFVIIIPIAIIAVYLQIYKRHINNALNNGEHRTQMASPHKVIIISTIVVLFIGVFASLFVGYKTAQNYYEGSIDEFSATDLEAYYAEVKEVNERTLTVKDYPSTRRNTKVNFNMKYGAKSLSFKAMKSLLFQNWSKVI